MNNLNNLIDYALLMACRDTKKHPGKGGICYNVKDRLRGLSFNHRYTAMGRLSDIIATWPEHSGMMDYPVPHHKLTAYKAYQTCLSRWTRLTRYGRARRRLLNYIINELEKGD
jgi:hypothetical protein